jgi:uncharacterized protein (TIGR00251 family)
VGWYQWQGKDLILHLRIQPKASRDAFIAPYGEGEFKVAISSPPVDGKANARLIRFIAKAFGLPKSAVTLEAGDKSRSKTLRLKSPKQLPPVIHNAEN